MNSVGERWSFPLRTAEGIFHVDIRYLKLYHCASVWSCGTGTACTAVLLHPHHTSWRLGPLALGGSSDRRWKMLQEWVLPLEIFYLGSSRGQLGSWLQDFSRMLLPGHHLNAPVPKKHSPHLAEWLFATQEQGQRRTGFQKVWIWCFQVQVWCRCSVCDLFGTPC